jgi:Domain of unknown function (DUF4162)
VLQRRLIAIDRPAALRERLRRGRVRIRVAGDAARLLPAAAGFDPRATAAGGELVASLASAETDTPRLIRALVTAGADIIEARQDAPDLEDVYLALVKGREVEAAS